MRAGIFALSQNSFAGTTFSDLIELEKVSFMPQVEIQSTASDQNRTMTTELVSEEVSTTDTFTSETDVSSDWSFVNSEIIDTEESYDEWLEREELIPNTVLTKGKCKTVKKKTFKTKTERVEKFFELYVRVVCDGIVINGKPLFRCDSKTKEAVWKTLEKIFGSREELECYEYYTPVVAK